MLKPSEGWILDIYPASYGMRVWILDQSGRASTYLDPWSPHFYLKAPPSEIENIHRLLTSFKTPFLIRSVEKKDFFTNQIHLVLEIEVKNMMIYPRVVERLLQLSMEERVLGQKISLYNADLNLPQVYFYERGLFPLSYCLFWVDESGSIKEWKLCDSCWDLEYALPPLRYAHLGFESIHGSPHESGSMDPNHAPGGSGGRGRQTGYLLTLGRDLGVGTSYLFEDSEEELLLGLNRHIEDWNPDIILSDWGDSYIMPRLQMHSIRTGIPLQFSRDPAKVMKSTKGHSFFSYGKFVYKAGPKTLFGRLHIDTRNSFTVSQTGLEGLFEISRVAKIPLQRAARCTIGTSLSSMQHEWAVNNDYLIPLDKGQTEDFRNGDELIASDRGGLVYEPEIGWHEDLIEFDFASMYPEIMIRHNISGEVINCVCCTDNKVPEIGHHICRHRKGMVPAVLAPIVEKRRQYKHLIAQGHQDKKIFKSRAGAFKWALVTCFGYLGFRNARFGKIEAHECVNAYSREALLTAKETAEAEGFHFLHAIIDSLWLKKRGVTSEEIEALRIKIEEKSGLPLGYEGRYRWIRFCTSRLNKRVGVPNRYFGAFMNKELKIRGIELRRHDTPEFIKNLQSDLLNIMAEAENLAELFKLRAPLDDVIEKYQESLKKGSLSPLDLALTLRLSQHPSAYRHDTLSAIAAKKLVSSGVAVHPGEIIQYVVSSEKDKIKDWRVTPLSFIDGYFEYDLHYYERLIERAVDITPFYSLPSHQLKTPAAVKKSIQLTLPGLT